MREIQAHRRPFPTAIKFDFCFRIRFAFRKDGTAVYLPEGEHESSPGRSEAKPWDASLTLSFAPRRAASKLIETASSAHHCRYLSRVLHSTMLDFRAAICTRMAYTAINERRNIATHAPTDSYGHATVPKARPRTTHDSGPSLFQDW
jgi:hypothetical protein